MRIEPVSVSNLAYCVQIGRELVRASTFEETGPDFDWGYTLANIGQLSTRDDYFIRVGYDDTELPVGVVGGHLTPYLFSPKVFAVEDCWFVRVGCKQRTKIGLMLMKAFMAWAYAHDAVYIQSGDVASIDSSAVWAA